MIKTIYINENDINSIKKAEHKKTQYENKGYTLVETKKITFNLSVLLYKTNEEVLKWEKNL